MEFEALINQDESTHNYSYHGDEEQESSRRIAVSVKDDSTGSYGGVKLIGSNYRTWKKMIEAHLCGLDKVGFVDGSIIEPPMTHKSYPKWKTANGSVTSILYKSMSEDISQMIMGCNTAAEIWASLAEIFYNGTDFSEVYELHTQASRMTQDGRHVSIYFAKLKSLWQEIDQRCPNRMKHAEDVKIYKEEQDLMRVHTFLAGLDPVFESAKSELLRQTVPPTLLQAFAYIRKDETQRIGAKPISTEVIGLAIQSKSQPFVSRHKFQGPPPGFSTSKLHCNYCKQLGHTKERCHKLVGYPPNFSKGKGKAAIQLVQEPDYYGVEGQDHTNSSGKNTALVIRKSQGPPHQRNNWQGLSEGSTNSSGLHVRRGETRKGCPSSSGLNWSY